MLKIYYIFAVCIVLFLVNDLKGFFDYQQSLSFKICSNVSTTVTISVLNKFFDNAKFSGNLTSS